MTKGIGIPSKKDVIKWLGGVSDGNSVEWWDSIDDIIDKFWDKMLEAPASKGHHCNYRGGLAVHTFRVMRHMRLLCNTYCMDMGECLYLALVHDIGKIYYYHIDDITGEILVVGDMDKILHTIKLLWDSGHHLSYDCFIAIMGHHGGWSIDKELRHNRLSVLLHTADMLAVIDENEGRGFDGMRHDA